MDTTTVYDADDVFRLIRTYWQPGDCFTANNVWNWLGEGAVLEHPNATMGSGFRIAQAAGVCRPTGRITQSTHPSRKHGMVRIWEWV